MNTTIKDVKVYSGETFTPIEMAFDVWLDGANSGSIVHDPSMIKLQDETHDFWSFCKVWKRWNAETKLWKVVRVGAGAYGDNTVYLEGN